MMLFISIISVIAIILIVQLVLFIQAKETLTPAGRRRRFSFTRNNAVGTTGLFST